MALNPQMIEEAVDRYWRELDRYAKLAEYVGDTCRRLMDDNVVRASVQFRAKDPERFRTKLQKLMGTGEHAAEFTGVNSVFRVVKDLSGARILTYVDVDRTRAVQLIQQRFVGAGADDAVEPIVKDQAGQFYRATHCSVRIQEEELLGRYRNLDGLECEIQVCSLLAHVYNEIEHDLRYKPLAGALSAKENGLLDALGHLTHSGDTLINETLNAVAERQRLNEAEFQDEHDFVVRMRQLFPDAPNFRANAGQLYEACMRAGWDSPQGIKDTLHWTDATADEGRILAQQLADRVNAKPDIQLKIDAASSDQLLVLLLRDAGRREQLKGLYPSGRGIGRAPRFLSVAKQLAEMP